MEVGDQGVHDLESIAGIDEDSGAPLSLPESDSYQKLRRDRQHFPKSWWTLSPTEMILPPRKNRLVDGLCCFLIDKIFFKVHMMVFHVFAFDRTERADSNMGVT